MNNNRVPSSMSLEREFQKIKLEINRLILNKKPQTPPSSLFERLDLEFKEIQSTYMIRKDFVNLLYVEHNYFWTKIFQFLERNPTESLRLFMLSLSKMLERNELRRYECETFEKMLGPYEVAIIRIADCKGNIDYSRLEDDLFGFIEKYCVKDISSEQLKNIINSAITIFIKGHYAPKIDTITISFNQFKDSEAIATKLLSLLSISEKVQTDKSFQSSLCFEVLYRLRKKQLHSLIQFQFFDKNENKQEEAEKIINRIIGEMIQFSENSYRTAIRIYKSRPVEEQNDIKIKLMITLKELDVLCAKYYNEAYYVKDIFRAWLVLDKIKHFLVTKAFKEKIPFSKDLLNYFAEEWALLYIFAKICLLNIEIIKRTSSLNQDWEKKMFLDISKNLEASRRLFKYNFVGKKDYSLKIFTTSFSGGFSEYFIHELCSQFFDIGLINEITPMEFKDLFECVKLVGRKDDIILNDVLEPNKPDIDIHIKNKCGILIKNAILDTDVYRKMWSELTLCEKHNITKVYYGINFIKNVQNIEYIRKFFDNFCNKHPTMSIQVFDIKDMVSAMMGDLEKSGKSKVAYSQMDLYRVLDY